MMALANALPRTRGKQDSKKKLRRIIKEKSLLSGEDFKLSSGRQSAFFFDMKKTMFDPEGINLIADIVYNMVRDDRDVQAIGGLEMGAVPIILGVCMRSANDRPIQGFFVRKEPKGHGTNKLIDGNLEPGSTVILFDDVTTTGGSALRAVDAVRSRGCKIKRVITIVDRLEGAQENFQGQGIELVPVFTRDDFAE